MVKIEDVDSFVGLLTKACAAESFSFDRHEVELRLNELPPHILMTASEDIMLLAAMFVTDMVITPVIKSGGSGIEYYYPFADYFLSKLDGTPAIETLYALRNRGLLHNKMLVDRVRHCPRCHSTRLNYIDVCPSCGSLDFGKYELIHCFSCGRVAPTVNFRRGLTLVCPFCDTRLRHLGSDYDHPLESHVCNECSEAFVDPDVRVICYDCKTRSMPDALIADSIYKLSLSDQGRTAVRLGKIDTTEAINESLNYAAPEAFMARGDWMLMMAARYAEDIFSIVGLRIANMEKVVESMGSRRALLMLDTLVERLQALMRDTDLITRSVQGIVWFLLPRTDPKGAVIVSERIRAIREAFSGDIKPDLSTVSYSLTSENKDEWKERKINDLMSKLSEQLDA